MTKAKTWATVELDLLKEYYPKLGRCQELQDLFPNRTMEAITLKASRIGLKVINNIRKARTNEWYLEQMENTNFVPLEEYKGSSIPILHMCGICDHEWLTRPQAVLRPGAKCPICSHRSRLTSIDKVDEVLRTKGLVRLSDYTGALDDLEVQHTTCGNIYITKYSYIEQGSGCPLCNKGFGYIDGKLDIHANATVYLLDIHIGQKNILKLGITLQPLHRRISGIKHAICKSYKDEDIRITPIHTILVDSPLKAIDIENSILNNPNLDRNVSVRHFVGHTELININSLELAVNLLKSYE